eukprot:TRINITY_DN9932_c0_g1_i1.p2 TRINITY_DN9932_c0_g1~~TRINITY_DN9932_c0_g1_i1.p2  ORF type:complete len:105 (+),score=13.61 TRINITY_DN9932_c0_g1_i1:124-438(+)
MNNPESWLTCFSDKCTEWCYRLPVDGDRNTAVLGKCMKRSDDDGGSIAGLDADQVIGIGVGSALGIVLVGSVVGGIGLGMRRQRRRRDYIAATAPNNPRTGLLN